MILTPRGGDAEVCLSGTDKTERGDPLLGFRDGLYVIFALLLPSSYLLLRVPNIMIILLRAYYLL